MTPRSLVSCFFAAYGLYLVITGFLGSGSALVALWMLRSMAGESHWLITAQHVAWLLPIVLGALLLFGSRALGGLAVRFAGVDARERLEFHGGARELLAVLFALLGVYLVVTQGAALLRVAFLGFQARAAGPQIAETAQLRLPDTTQLVSLALGVVAGLLLVRKNNWVVSLVFPADSGRRMNR